MEQEQVHEFEYVNGLIDIVIGFAFLKTKSYLVFLKCDNIIMGNRDAEDII